MGADYIPVRLPEDLRDRLERLGVELASQPEIAAAAGPRGVTRSHVIRVVLLAGMEALEARYAKARRGR